MEQFKEIKGFERYTISSHGRVFGVSGQEISQRKSTNGYLRVNVRRGNVKYEKPTVVSVHRLVAEAFLPKIEGKTHVNHIDGNKCNNHVNNLEWCTPKENSVHAYVTQPEYRKKCARNIKMAQKSNGRRIKAVLSTGEIKRFNSKREAAAFFGVDEKTIYNYLTGRTTPCGFSFCSGGDLP
jgi:hypothetical protein